MPNTALFLHITDAHLTSAGTEFPRDDHKVRVPGIYQDTREAALRLMLQRLSERLAKEGRRLSGVLFSGDAQHQGRPGGHQLLLDMLLENLAAVGATAANIVAVPGNHDVVRGSQPGSLERYADFVDAWRKAGCVTPWLDGVDDSFLDGGEHRLVAQDGSWAVFPINTSNWSQVNATLPEPLRSVWEKISETMAGGDAEKEARLRHQLNELARYDMARISSQQLEVVRGLIETSPRPVGGVPLRIAVLHHHLRAPSLREEVKPFADVSNLEQLRSFLRDRRIAIALHGHKHEQAVQFDHVYDQDGESQHRTLVISGSTFEPGNEADSLRLITITGLPNSPSVTIEPISLPRGGVDAKEHPPIIRRLWSASTMPGSPTLIQGTDLDEVYERACEAAGAEAANGMLVVHLDLPASAGAELPLPTTYPLPEPMEDADRRRWLSELVAWWQLERSGLEHRMPFVHGSRLRRFGGKINQIERIIKLLREKPSTRALAVLVDPFRDFTEDGQNEEFASFCLVEFKRRDVSGSQHFVDAIAFYRAQEFARWWPINVAELRLLQHEICGALSFLPGRITTIAGDARTHSRSPTQVAMPIIDRWLDQAPERLYLLGNALAQCTVRVGRQRDAVRGWFRTLADLEAAAKEYNPDGLPIAIEGLKHLGSYLEVIHEDGEESLAKFVRVLLRLARANETYEKGARTRSDFDRWGQDALDLLADLREMTISRVGALPAP
ncbi:metallophosphoesterase [Mesorhizobium sp. L-8-10]|uniref:metallophosphoesterase n=1 Tax=Mesorhizobium sp. L-8-10 TaxID=2744523 RepID=UPI001925B3F4|nr:metallophosphoesterase [Mesorhizobium sp. L-8-10]